MGSRAERESLSASQPGGLGLFLLLPVMSQPCKRRAVRIVGEELGRRGAVLCLESHRVKAVGLTDSPAFPVPAKTGACVPKGPQLAVHS